MHEAIENIIINTILEEHEVTAIYVFGSYARDEAKPGSDIDIAILQKEGLSSIKLFDLKDVLEEKLNLTVDIVSLYDASTVLAFEILKESKLLYVSDKYEKDTFEYLTLSYYQKLNEERKLILEDIEKRGNIYG